MLGRFTHLLHAHHLRQSDGRELRQLYASTSLHLLAFSLVTIFVPVYLYLLGYGMTGVALFYVVHYSVRFLVAIPVAKAVNRFGVKHILVASYLLTFVKTSMLVTLPDIGWPLLLLAAVDGIDHITYFLPNHIGISQLKTAKQAGRQLSLIFQWHKLASALGPIIGGVIAHQLGIGYTLATAALLVIVSIIPLTLSPEITHEIQKISLRRLPWRRMKRDLISGFGLSLNQLSTEGMWALFLGVFIFTQDAYLGLGIISFLGLLFAIFLARFFGHLIDKHRGRHLLRLSVLAQSVTHALRPWLPSVPMAYIFNLASQPSAIGVALPYGQGVVIKADELVGHRISYLTAMELVNYVGKILAWGLVLAIAAAGNEKLGLQTVFLLSIPAIWLVLSENFRSLRPRAR